jgi:ribosomal protein S12 methylthiotransferase accessory factor
VVEVTTERPIVFLGPSMPVTDAQRIVNAEYRRPIKRGDLTEIASGSVVAIVDGVFEQSLSVSPSEVLEAVTRGVVVFGGASMGALRAAEVPGVIGVGLIFSWYRDGIITRDDEVALLFEDTTDYALTVPTVNVRFAVERLRRPGTIDRATADKLLAAALELPFKRRTYPAIVKLAGVADRADCADLIRMLQAHDLKYLDAETLLEAVDRHMRQQQLSAGTAASVVNATTCVKTGIDVSYRTAKDEVLIWESGDRVTGDELFEFLVFTGKLEAYARSAISCYANVATSAETGGRQIAGDDPQAVFNSAVRRWGWLSSEEAKVTLSDLALDLPTLDKRCVEEAAVRKAVLASTRMDSVEFRRALWAELFLNDLALKRETMRLGSVRFFAENSVEPATSAELREAQTVLCKANREFDFWAVRNRWAHMGLADQKAQDSFVELLARARKSGRELATAMNGGFPQLPLPSAGETPAGETSAGGTIDFLLGPCAKPEGESRFCLPIATALEHTTRLREVIGISRVGMIGELGDLGGVHVAQAARPGGAWSSSYGSGKSLTTDGAIVGSIMEEIEKWTQEQFRPHDEELIVGSFAQFQDSGRFISPETLALPYDSVYSPDLPLHWFRCFDLLARREVHLPIDVVQMSRRKHDICFTQRGARKHLATNGLGAGFSREEAVLHATCEYVERHALRLAEIFLANPGGLGGHPYRFVDLETTSDRVQDLAQRLSHDASVVRVLDITSDVAIPTFVASVTRDLKRADGYGTHPDPEVAIEMALLEAAQTIASAIAGGREDLSIKARSLGRHERPRPISVNDAWFWLDPDTVCKSVDEVVGLSSNDVYEDLRWALDRLRAAGVRHVPVVDLTVPAIEPAHVVRVVVPGLESNNPFFTGPRARLVLLRDLLPRWR